MRKFFTAIFFLFMLASMSYGAVSEDTNVYVRQDVFDAKMENMFLRLHGEIERLEIKIDGSFRELSARINGIEKRMDTMNTFLYYLLVLLGALLLLPFVNKLWESHEAKKQQSVITLEDVKRLIAEAKLNTMPQA